MSEPIQSFDEFWPYYVLEHRVASNRTLHFIGSTLVLIVAAFMVYSGQWLLFFALPFVGYGFAWTGHFFIEKNKPASFKYPFYSLIADWKMWAYMLVGRMESEVEKALARQPA